MKKHLTLCLAMLSILCISATAQLPSYLPTDGLVGWWPFNGNANDESGNGNDGTVNGATLTEDRFGNADAAYGFDNAFIDVGNSNELNITDSGFTASIWVKKNSAGDAWHILGKRISCDGPDFQYQIASNILPEGIVWGGYTPGELSLVNSGIVMDNNEWNMITGTFYDNMWSLYLNGTLNNSLEAPITDVVQANLIFGQSGICGGFSGSLDDIGIWNRALTEQEITALYTGQCPQVATNCTPLPSNLQDGLVGYWPFCGDANDESGNGNDGTVNGATLTEDRFGNADAAYGFDGVDDFVEILHTPELSLTSEEFSISAWYTSNQSSITDNRNILCKSDGAGPFNKWVVMKSEGLGFYPEGIGLITHPIINESAFNGFISTSNLTELETWNQIVISKQSALITIFINGEIQLSVPVSNNIAESNANLRIGGDEFNSIDNAKFWAGLIDDIGIWNRALTAEEVQQLYTLDACTFTVYDTSYVTVYDTLTTYETVYDTLYTYETIYDTVTTYVTVTDTLLIDITFVGFEGQPSWLNTVTVFPNPASDHITIDYGNFALMAGHNTVITDAAGATVYSSSINSQQAYIDINAWGATGVYYMTIYDASGAAVAVRHIVLE